MTSEEQLVKATNIVSWLAGIRKKVTAKRIKWLKPFKEQIKFIEQDFKDYLRPFNEADSIVSSKIMTYRREQEDERLKQETAAKKQAQQEHIPAKEIMASSDIKEKADSSVGSATFSKHWTWKIKDKKKIPEKYWVLDEVSINTDVRNGRRNIEGLEIYQEERLNRRT